MRSVTGLRLPTIAGTHGFQPSSKKCSACTGMNAWRASVRSGFCVAKKSGHSTTRYMQISTPALNSARWCLRNRHHTSFQLDATAIRSSACRADGAGRRTRSYVSIRMRGSIIASAMSDSSVPTMVRNE